MSKYGDTSDKQEIYEELSYLKERLDLSMSEFVRLSMQVLADMME